jgi:hypothetical protein
MPQSANGGLSVSAVSRIAVFPPWIRNLGKPSPHAVSDHGQNPVWPERCLRVPGQK